MWCIHIMSWEWDDHLVGEWDGVSCLTSRSEKTLPITLSAGLLGGTHGYTAMTKLKMPSQILNLDKFFFFFLENKNKNQIGGLYHWLA
jgi:hypothetical protein